MVMLLGAVCWWRENRYIPTKCTLFQILHQTRAQNTIQCHYYRIWNICVIKFCFIVLRPIFDQTHKGKQVENTYDLYIKNWSYCYKAGIVFAMYQRMRSKGTSWAAPQLLRVVHECCRNEVIFNIYKHKYIVFFATLFSR